jgi:hypothetical protein
MNSPTEKITEKITERVTVRTVYSALRVNVIPILLSLSSILLISLVYLVFFLNGPKQKEITDSKEEVARIRTDSIRLDSTLLVALDSMETLKVDNKEKEGTITAMQENLRSMGNTIGIKLRFSGMSKEEFDTEMKKFNEKVEQYKTDIAQHKKTNKELDQRIQNEKEAYASQKQVLMKQLDSIIVIRNKLAAESKRCVAEKEDLSIKYKDLNQKSLGASFLPVTISSIIPKYGKKTTQKANRVDFYQISFVTGVNPLVEVGEQIFYLRVMKSNGTVVKIGDKETTVDGTPLRYLESKSVNYSGVKEEHSFRWETTNEKLEAGNYKLEIYNNNKLVGEALFSLK